jgi:hypothetical protein
MNSLPPAIGWKTNRVPHPGEVREDASRVWVAGQLNLRTNEVAANPVLQELRFRFMRSLILSGEWILLLAFCSVIPNKILSELCGRIMLRGFDSGLTLPSRY